ncbi:GIY-YIG nuclease family protein [Parasphingopyxis algicola]|uniref:GIY-YIG nuclease family protein n=1 Tax=Parasphingopyxis algicola TaxID=2026624 RepID=UPI0015A0FF77|nr:GIY-YIG nuclease family protein [Parasphingopyxis algicola]QLC24584.1 GIY-YIG nuclease family protein [Parasphingopyxis algicola]
MERKPCVYILAKQFNGALYIGVTSNLLKRLHQHRNGLSKGHASRYRIARLVRFEMFDDMEHAIAREKQLKNWHREWKMNLIESENPNWVDLAVGLGLDSAPDG